MDVQGAVAIVTGAASGLGEATARRLAADGAIVVLADVNAEGGKRVAAEIGGHFVHTDVTDEEATRRVCDEAATLGPVRVLANIAGGGAPPKRILSRDGGVHDLASWDFTIALNLTGPFNMVRHALPHMSAASEGESGQRGVVVNCASIAGWEGAPGLSAYAAAKSGLQGFTLSAARELARFGIRVNCIVPGFYAAPTLVALQDAGHGRGAEDALFPSRLGKPEEFASLVAHLVENDFLNALIVRADAGYRLGSLVR